LPTYFIFLDQHYYEQKKSRLLMTVLEDPLRAAVRLPHDALGGPERLARALERLRAAVRDSRVLQAEARQYGAAWLRNRVKVHVNITNRADPSFWGGGLISTVFGYPDNVMRDHRKLAFRDVSEADPLAGRAILTGMGVGAHYLGPRWEDRSLLVRGPALLDLRRAARDLLLSQGLAASALPVFLRTGPVAGGAHRRSHPRVGPMASRTAR
jgi:phosphatidylserine/phosphatidylglycerophosphate/cardiolipin synthase-like enzyme